MKLIVYFRILLTVLLLGGPIMACAIPDGQLTAAEKQCCKTSVQRPHDFRPSSTFSRSVPYLVISVVEFLSIPCLAEQSGQSAPWLSRALSPPLATLDASTPLRI